MAGASLFANLARGAKVLALLLFLLPWVAVSCSPDAMERVQNSAQTAPRSGPALGNGVTIARASGLNMAMGTLQMMNPAEGLGEPGVAANQARAPSVPPEIGVIAAAVLILLALIGSFLIKGSAGALAGIGGSALAIAGLCYSVFVHYPPSVIAALAAGNGRPGGSNMTAEQVGQILSVKTEALFYIVLVVLALAILFNVLAMRRRDVAPAAAAPAEPPAGV